MYYQRKTKKKIKKQLNSLEFNLGNPDKKLEILKIQQIVRFKARIYKIINLKIDRILDNFKIPEGRKLREIERIYKNLDKPKNLRYSEKLLHFLKSSLELF